MNRRIKTAAEVFGARLVPGALNVLVLFLLAHWLSPHDYGLASTFMATSAAAANLLFGSILQSALVSHAEHSADGKQTWFEEKHLANALALSVVIAAGGFAVSALGLFDWRIPAAAAAFGLYTSVLQIPQARLQFIRFGIGSTSQSLAFLAFAWLLVRSDPSPESVLEAFGLSYVVGAVVSAAVARARLSRPSLTLFKSAIAMGASATFSNVAADGFSLVCRYLLVATSQLDILATFSFSVDLAQKTVAIFINIATFAVVPHALRSARSGDVRELWRSLARGWSVAASASLLSAGAILLLGTTSLIPALNGQLYNPISFVLVAAAVTVNRSSKMLLTPVAIRLRKASRLLTPFLVVSPIALLLVYLGLLAHIPYALETGYLLTFVAWSAAVYFLLIPNLRRTANQEAFAERS